MKKLMDYLPETQMEDEVLVQAKVRKSLRERGGEILAQKNITWKEFIEASLTMLIDEQKRRSS